MRQRITALPSHQSTADFSTLSANCVEKLRLIEAPVADSLLLVRGDSAMMGERRVMQEALFYGFA
jgi:hypothetical protein